MNVRNDPQQDTRPQPVSSSNFLMWIWGVILFHSSKKSPVTKEEEIDITDEVKVFSDILTVNVIDSYMNLTLKSVFILKYLSDINGLSNKLKTVMKTDDDCYVNIQALGHLIKNNNFGKSFLGK